MSQGGEDGEINDKTSSGTEVDVLYSVQVDNANDFAKDDDDNKSQTSILGFLTDRANILGEDICFEDFDEIKPPVSNWFEISNYIPFSYKEKLYSGCRISTGNDTQKWLKAYDVLYGREVNGIISMISANKSKYNLIYLRDLEIRTAEKLKKPHKIKGLG
jgi:hypothetical protein